MGWTTDEVDNYVAKVERNMDSPREKNLKGFAFARLYREAHDNSKAKRHLEAYLSVNESDFRGHRMMGQLFEETGNLEKALLSYRRSLDLNNTQHDLVLKVVELYCKVPVDPGRARAWADRAARLFPGHQAVFKLKMHLLESVGKVDYDQMEDLISEEMAKSPRDADLHIRLIKVYAATGRLVEAFSHCSSVVKTKAFADNQEWWMCAADVFEKYMAGQDRMLPSDRDIGIGHVILDSHAHLLGSLCHLVNLHLKTEQTRECINAFYRLDHCLTLAYERKVRQLPQRSQSHKSEWDVVLAEIRGQLYLYSGTLILRLAKENYLTWPRALKLACVCYMTCAQILEPEINTPWVAKAPKTKDALRWYHMSCHRLSHTGHLLGAVIHKYGGEWLDTCISDWCTHQGQGEILNTIYSDQRDIRRSFLANDEEFLILEINLPSVDHLVKYDGVCVGDNPRNLELITWIGLHWYQYQGSMRPGVGVMVGRIFDGLRMDVLNIEQTAADTLCLRDLEAFIYAIIRTSASKHLEDQDLYIPDYQPNILPQQLCCQLTSSAQEDWWLASYNLYSGAASVSHAGRVRATVQRGLEVIRALGIHGLHVRLLIHLAFNFGDKASYLKTAGMSPWHYEEHWKSLQARSLHYWKEALILLEKTERNENIPVRKDPLFPALPDSMQMVDIKFNIQKARITLGEAAVKEGRIEDAMEMFEQVKTPQGMWNLAQIYKYLANVEAQAAASEELDSEAQSSGPTQEYYNCLNKARELLLTCMDKLSTEERRRQTLQDELNNIEDMLNDDPNRSKTKPRKQLDFRQLDFQASRSSTTMSDVQESEDNFWLEQPQDASSKDLIAKLSEVTLNNGLLQEQMALRDQHLFDLNHKVQNLESELQELKRHRFSGIMTPTNFPSPSPQPSVTTQGTATVYSSPVLTTGTTVVKTSITPTNSRQQLPQNGHPLESTPITRPSAKSRLGPRPVVETPPELPKIDSNFFAGLGQSNSPEKRFELEESGEDGEDGESDQERRKSTSYDDGIHFNPIIPLPKKIEPKTGEEGEEVLFTKRAKLYRFDRDLKAWKERGLGIFKILGLDGDRQFRILMRREHILKICANHLITTDMELKPLKSNSVNSLLWTTLADFSDEVPKVEQLAVKFKSAEEATEFKEVFEKCKEKLSTAGPERAQEQGKSKDSPKDASWSCSICSGKNLSSISICVACGANKLDSSSSSKNSVGSDSGSKDALPFSDETKLFTKFTPKVGSWECSTCLVNNEPGLSLCAACGTAKQTSPGRIKTDGLFGGESVFPPMKSLFSSAEQGKSFYFDSQQPSTLQEKTNIFGANSAFIKPSPDVTSNLTSGVELNTALLDSSQKFPFEFKPESSSSGEAEETKTKKVVFDAKPAPFSFAYQPSSSSTAPMTFRFGSTQAQPSTLGPFGVSSSPNASSKEAASTPSSFSFTFGSSKTPESKEQETSGNPLTFSSSPSSAMPGFDIDDEEEGEDSAAPSVLSASSTGVSPGVPTHAPSQKTGSPATIPPELFWQQQLEEKFRFGNLHKTEPLAGMTPVVVPTGGKPDAFYPASFVLSQMASNPVSPGAQTTLLTPGKLGAQRPELLLSMLQGKPQENAASGNNQAQYLPNNPGSSMRDENGKYTSDDETDSEDDSYSYDSSEVEDFKDRYIGEFPVPIQLTKDPPAQKSDSGDNSYNILNRISGIPGRKYLTVRSPLKKSQTKEDECVIVYEIRAAKTDRDKAARLLLPPNFFNYAREEPCKGCLGCDEEKRLELRREALVSQPKSKDSENKAEAAAPTGGAGVFGTSSGVQTLSFASVSFAVDGTFSKKGLDHYSFPRAGQQLFASSEGDATDNSEQGDIHYKPVIPLPDLVEVMTGEEDHTLLFSERAKLYRFDVSSGMWKERGVGDIKLLLDDKSGRGRVVMRRDQVRKLCANHWVTKDMELRTNSTSDRSWVWQTLADFSEEIPSQEKLAVRFKLPQTSAKFKDVFDDMIASGSKTTTKENDVDARGPKLQLKSEQAEGTWECSVCYIVNKEEDNTCLACGHTKESTSEEKPEPATIKTSVLPDSNSHQKQGPPKATLFGDPGKAAVLAKPVFTIGRHEVPEETLEEENYRFSPSRNSPSKAGVKPTSPVKTTETPNKSSSSFAFGSTGKFNFRLDMSPDNATPTSSVRSPKTPTSPGSPGSHPEAEDDGIHFAPVIPLPKKIAKKTGEENEKVLFCHRSKLYRFDAEGNQWKERGLGDVKILRNLSSGKSRVLMRRDNILKICTNHQITSEMTIKPNAGSDKSWVWNTLADFADEVPKPETFAIRFKTSEVAVSFKDAFEMARDGIIDKNDSAQSKDGTEGKKNALPKTDGALENTMKEKPQQHKDTQREEDDGTPKEPSMPEQKTQDKEVSSSTKEEISPKNTEKHELKEEQLPPSSFLFGSPSISTLSFAAVAAKLESSPVLKEKEKTEDKFEDAGLQLFSKLPVNRRESESEEQDGPHFEPLIALPEKVELRTGEEEEEVIFSHRAKLYRFHKDLMQWKERGIGDIKILFHKKNGRVRILMRREQVLKICANHSVTPEMELKPNGTSNKSWVWQTLADFSDEEVKPEQLAVRFKFQETAREFQEKFEKCQQEMVNMTPETDTLSSDSKLVEESDPLLSKEKSLQGDAKGDSTLMEKFKPKLGAWECEACLIQNNPDSTACVACQTLKPGSKQEPATLSVQSRPKFNFSAPPQGEASQVSLMDKFKPIPGAWNCEACLIQNKSDSTSCVACQTAKPGSKQDQPLSRIQNEPKFTFGASSQSPMFSFGKSTAEMSESKSLENQPKFTFGAPTQSSQIQPKFGQNITFSFGKSNAEMPTSGSLQSQAKFSFGTRPQAQPQDEESQVPLMEKFKPIPGAWDCETCLIQNNPDSTACVACQAPKPGSKQQPTPSVQSQPKFSSGSRPQIQQQQQESQVSLMEKFKPIPGAWDCEACLIQNKPDSTACVACQTLKPGSTQESATSSVQSQPMFTFGAPKGDGFSVSSAQNEAPAAFSFGGGFPVEKSTGNSSEKPQFTFGTALVQNENLSNLFGANTFGSPSLFGIAAEGQSNAQTSVPQDKDKRTFSTIVPTDSDQVASENKEEAEDDPLGAELKENIPPSPKLEISTLDEDLTISLILEPSADEKLRAERLLLPQGFFLYERKSSDKPSSQEKPKKESQKTEELPVLKVKEEKAVETTEPKDVFGSSSNKSFASFSDFPTGQGFEFAGKAANKGFAGQGLQLFSSPSAETSDEHGRDIHFEPLVNLPKVEVVTGEENEEIVFCHRAKLYRFDTSILQWKERGVGNMKLLKHKDGKRFRVLMRRDHIHKVCANHCITTEMKLVLNVGTDRSWVWHTSADLSEGEPNPEQLAVRFKLAATAEEFKKVFEECQQFLRDGCLHEEERKPVEDDVGIKDEEETTTVPNQPSKSTQNIGKKLSFVGESFNRNVNVKKEAKPSDLVPDSSETWECCSCYVPNRGTDNSCIACGGSRPEVVSSTDTGATPNKQNLSNTRPSDATQQELLVAEADSTVPEVIDLTEKETPSFLFGTHSISSLSFSDVGKKPLFGQVSSAEPISFKGLNDQKPSEECKENEDQGEGYHNVSGDHIHFEPIIPLPEKVEVVTGEEHEDVVFKQRAKLYRYDKEAKQWKERGVGDMKILTKNGRARILMRREQIHKLCANHLITPDMDLKPNNNDRSWVWQTLADFSEEEAKPEQLAIRFKTAENAKHFKEQFEACRDSKIPSSSTNDEDNAETTRTVKEETAPEKPLQTEEEGPEDDPSEIKVTNKENTLVIKSENEQHPSSSTSLTEDTTAKLMALTTGKQSTFMQQEFHSSSTFQKQVTQQKITNTYSKTVQEQRVADSDGAKNEESNAASAMALQHQNVSSSNEGTPFGHGGAPFSFLGQPQSMVPLSQLSIFNRQLISGQQAGGFSPPSGSLFGRQSVFQTGLVNLNPPGSEFETMRTTKQSSSSQASTTKRTEVVSQEGVVQQTEMKVEKALYSSMVTKVVSCSPEITQMLEEVQNADQK